MNTFLLPDLGEGLTEAEIVRWLVKVGDVVTVDTPVAEVETAKSLVELPSPYGGIVEELHGEPGTTIPVGKPLITIAESQEPAAEAYRKEERAGSGNVLIGYGTGDGAGVGRRRKRRPHLSGRSLPASANNLPETAPKVPLVISPLVRRLARDAEVDLRELAGTGPDGLIVRRDVELAIAQRLERTQTPATAQSATPAAAQPETPAVQPKPETPAAAQAVPAEGERVAGATDSRTGLAELRRIPMSGFRKVVAATLSRSRQEIPEATTWVDVDATALIDLRESLRSATDPGPGLLALMARFVVAGLQKYPELNGFVDTEREELVQYEGINLGLAAQTDRGLVVPAVVNAHQLTTRGLDAEIRRLTQSARAGRLTPYELSCGTFTLNNYGSFGVDGSAAIINHPQVAILGVGRIIDRPWVVNGEVAIRKLTQLSFVFDHRVCDGGTAAAFLRFVADAFENPASVFADL
ncbi:pyruvate dehydrogenase E2 component (dihydrolipoamide acetyltransferase) [Kribbella antiqua]|uniref:Dihydrolipoamide acetyltransferase component of pyruvate dehydrogenase complex n=1 Tax=Kribbella antiqua TaxID=2512217 RepID=A0A4R2IV70_9ACTN|nr:dihydrolipoamide acetyltransferase family protein [Kribbella antiqua]TCO49067.1 pyruvate dehydrogenase E2 component (dihydrolipoamide acetyltransferase) [Kribbella antiqua]